MNSQDLKERICQLQQGLISELEFVNVLQLNEKQQQVLRNACSLPYTAHTKLMLSDLFSSDDPREIPLAPKKKFVDTEEGLSYISSINTLLQERHEIMVVEGLLDIRSDYMGEEDRYMVVLSFATKKSACVVSDLIKLKSKPGSAALRISIQTLMRNFPMSVETERVLYEC